MVHIIDKAIFILVWKNEDSKIPGIYNSQALTQFAVNAIYYFDNFYHLL